MGHRVDFAAFLVSAACLGLAPSIRAQDAATGSPGQPPDDKVVVAQIDELVRGAWTEASIEPSAPAKDEEWVRRVYLDVLGRVPSVDEATAFLNAKEADKRAQLVAHLLKEPDYPKHFATIWRVALIGRNNPDRRRVDPPSLEAWLRRQFLDNVPWDQTVRELVTAQGNNKQNGATNFTLAHMQDNAVNLTSYTTRLFLGQQIQCTQCHDHPENDWKQADFWSINAFFKGVKSKEITRVDSAGAEVRDSYELFDTPTTAFATYENRNATMDVAFPVFLDGRAISRDTDVNRREELARFITEPANQQFSRAFVNWTWGHFLGRGIVHPVDDFGDHNPPTNPELLELMATSFRQSGYDVRALVRWITASAPYQLTSAATKENAEDETLFSRMALKPMTPEQLFDSILVASNAHKAGGDQEADDRRRNWLRQFTFAFGNDDGEETDTFQGTIPQALMMMNGEVMNRATSLERGSFLAGVMERARSERKPEAFVASMLYLSALSRRPTAAELTRAMKLFQSARDTPQLVQDLYWSLLNSNEFIMNH
jgi:hypothetical protein